MHDLIVSFDGMNACQLIPSLEGVISRSQVRVFSISTAYTKYWNPITNSSMAASLGVYLSLPPDTGWQPFRYWSKSTYILSVRALSSDSKPLPEWPGWWWPRCTSRFPQAAPATFWLPRGLPSRKGPWNRRKWVWFFARGCGMVSWTWMWGDQDMCRSGRFDTLGQSSYSLERQSHWKENKIGDVCVLLS